MFLGLSWGGPIVYSSRAIPFVPLQPWSQVADRYFFIQTTQKCQTRDEIQALLMSISKLPLTAARISLMVHQSVQCRHYFRVEGAHLLLIYVFIVIGVIAKFGFRSESEDPKSKSVQIQCFLSWPLLVFHLGFNIWLSDLPPPAT